MAEKSLFSLQNMVQMLRESTGEGLLNLFLSPGIVLQAQGEGTEMIIVTGMTTGAGVELEAGTGIAMTGIVVVIKTQAIVAEVGAVVTVLVTLEAVAVTVIMMRGVGADLLRVPLLLGAALVHGGACLLPGAFPRVRVILVQGVRALYLDDPELLEVYLHKAGELILGVPLHIIRIVMSE